MAKKVVATLKNPSNDKKIVKVVRTVRSQKTGAYAFKEEFIPLEDVKNYFTNK
jgi:hypothetical protein